MSSDLGDSGHVGVCVVESTWRVGEVSKHVKIQTDQIGKEDSGAQTTASQTISTQTETATSTGNNKEENADANLVSFLNTVVPTMEDQLKQNLESHAFDDYNVNWTDDGDTISKLHVLQHDWLLSSSSTLQARGNSNDAEETNGRVTMCSDVAWNSNGTVIAAAYGSPNHEGWCQDRAGLCFWNIMRRNVGESGKADVVVEVPCSLMCISFHPEEPTIIVGGLFNGEIRVWDIANIESDEAEPMIMSSTVDDYFHREPIAQVAWMRDMRASYLIVSINGDGKVLFWSMANKLAYPVSGLAIVPSPSYFGQGAAMNRHPVMGGTAISISSLDFSNFVLGTEAGGVLRCVYTHKGARSKGLVKSGEFKWTNEAYKMIESTEMTARFDVKRQVENFARLNNVKAIDIPCIFAARPDPVRLFAQASKFAFEAHAGPVYALASSPFHRNLFLSCSTDGTARLYNILRPKPLLYIELAPAYLYDVAWSPARPLVFAIADSEGKVHVYDLRESMLAPVLVVRVCDSIRVTSISFNAKDPSLLAAADQTGNITVFQLGPRLSTLQSGEQLVCDQLGAEIT